MVEWNGLPTRTAFPCSQWSTSKFYDQIINFSILLSVVQTLMTFVQWTVMIFVTYNWNTIFARVHIQRGYSGLGGPTTNTVPKRQDRPQIFFSRITIFQTIQRKFAVCIPADLPPLLLRRPCFHKIQECPSVLVIFFSFLKLHRR